MHRFKGHILKKRRDSGDGLRYSPDIVVIVK